jgi:hypothetical protein
MQVFHDGVAKFWAAAIAIQILDAQHESAAMSVSAFLRAPESLGMAKMEQTGGRWSEAASVLFDHAVRSEIGNLSNSKHKRLAANASVIASEVENGAGGSRATWTKPEG